jgi:5'-nucleotidase
MRLNPRHLGAAAIAAVSAVSLAAGSLAATATVDDGRAATYRAKAATDKYVKLDLLAINDFHGQLEVVPSSSSSGRINSTPAGGAAYLAADLRQERRKSRAGGATPITVAAGDLIGASPLLSAAFHDEPTIEALNKMGLQVASVGNHEFDEGVRELRRMQRGGCLRDEDGENGANSCPDGSFGGADFRYLAANVVWKHRDRHRRPTVFPGVKVMEVQGEKVAFIGMTLEATDQIVSPSGIQQVDFTDEVRTANAIVPKLRERGIKSIFVLLHEGIDPAGDRTAYNDCTGPTGPALEIAQRLRAQVDAVVSGHTHQPYNCVVKDPKGNNRLLTSASSLGRMVTKLHFLIDPKSGDVVRPAAFAENQIVENGEGQRAAGGILDLIAKYTELVAPIRDEVIGHIAPTTEPEQQISRTADANGGDSPLGNLIADAQKEDATIDDQGEPVIALMNSGGIRADLLENGAGDITYGAAFDVQPFNNLVTSMDLTGAELKAILNQQWNGANESTKKILQVSGLTYTWDASQAALPDTDALVAVTVDHDGDPVTPEVPLEDGATYRVAMNNFIADGGDGFTLIPASGDNRLTGGLDIDSLVEYLKANDPVSPTPTTRISQQP